MEVVIVLVVIAVAIGIWMISVNNRYAWLENLVRESWSGIDVQLKRRYDLIPNLVEAVKGYAAHEQQVFENIVRAREHASQATAVKDQAASNQELSRAVTTLLARAEAYPQLMASANFMDLQRELANTEDRIAAARRFYNANVRDFNTLLHSFPSSLLANGRREKDYFEIDPIEIHLPKVSLAGSGEAGG